MAICTSSVNVELKVYIRHHKSVTDITYNLLAKEFYNHQRITYLFSNGIIYLKEMANQLIIK